MPELPECTLSSQTSSDLKQLARDNTGNLRYLDHLPRQLLNTVDVALVVEDVILPVHSVILMASSPIFSEILAAQIAAAQVAQAAQQARQAQHWKS